MFYRKSIEFLETWRAKKQRKPLVIRGARQVGKTTLVKQFAKQYKYYVYIDLDEISQQQLFEEYKDTKKLLDIILLQNGIPNKLNDTLFFLDEIQSCETAFYQLRYFYEHFPKLSVIVAGSLLERLMIKNTPFPVGRVEYMYLYPASFEEFLGAIGKKQLLAVYQQEDIPKHAHTLLLEQFNIYANIGGMPEIVNHFAQTNDYTGLASIYESLLLAYKDDVEKYASNETEIKVIRFIINEVFTYGSQRITFAKFGNSTYRSREMSEAFRTLEDALLLYLNYPSASIDLPIQKQKRKSPRLELLDTGLMNFANSWQAELIGVKDMNKIFKGRVAEHIVGQELRNHIKTPLNPISFWTREKDSDAEVDYIIPFKGKVIPIEVKAGKAGRLRSLHQFMDRTEHKFAVRFYAGEKSIEQTKTIKGKKFTLINLPHYCAGRLLIDLKKLID